jgi:tetratricopeptide (TPR) repeat protein
MPVVGAVLALVALGLAGTPAAAQSPLEGLRLGMRAQAAFTEGRALYDRREYVAARRQLLEAVTLDPGHDEAHALLAWTQYHLAEYRGAAITFKAVLRRRPDWGGLYDGLGWSRYRLGRFHLATEAFRSALDRNPDFVDALVGLGSAQFDLGRYETALPPLQRALQQMSTLVGSETADVPGVRAKAAWSLYYLGRYREALATFERAIRFTPEGHGLHNGLGWCYLKLGEKDRARAAFERALALKPDYEDAREGLRQIDG